MITEHIKKKLIEKGYDAYSHSLTLDNNDKSNKFVVRKTPTSQSEASISQDGRTMKTDGFEILGFTPAKRSVSNLEADLTSIQEYLKSLTSMYPERDAGGRFVITSFNNFNVSTGGTDAGGRFVLVLKFNVLWQ